MIVVNRTIVASDTDALANTDLANIPGPGQLDIFIASTQNDSVFTLTGPGVEPLARLIRIAQRTNGEPLLSDDTPYSMPVGVGHYTLNLSIVTAATIGFRAIYRSVDEV